MYKNNIRLRALEPEDIEFLYSWENDPDIWKVSNTIVPFSHFILKKYIEESHLDIYQVKQLRLVIEVSHDTYDLPVGLIDLFDFDPYHQRAGIGILIADQKDRKRGYGKTALELLIEYSFNVLGLHQLYCNVTNDNENSLKLFKAAGFEVVGKKKEWIKDNNKWLDEYLLQLIAPKR